MTPANSSTVADVAALKSDGIACRTKGIPMRADVTVDAEGFHCFEVDPDQQCPFNVLDRMIAAVNKAAA